MPQNHAHCLYCQRDSDQVPLVVLKYQGEELWICPQHFPILIHKPEQLVDKLPGAAQLSPPENHLHEHH